MVSSQCGRSFCWADGERLLAGPGSLTPTCIGQIPPTTAALSGGPISMEP